jgi:Zinc knuckle.
MQRSRAWETVTERLLHEGRKKSSAVSMEAEKGLATLSPSTRKTVECFRCGKFGHVKKNCRVKLSRNFDKGKDCANEKANKVGTKYRTKENDSDGGDYGLPARHVLAHTRVSQNSSWIVDSGATCHMCNNKDAFEDLKPFKKALKITLGDGRGVEAKYVGRVRLNLRVGEKENKCTLNEVLLVPELAFNLLSISKASERGVTAEFRGNNCLIMNRKHCLLGIAEKVDKLYLLKSHRPI